MFGWWSATSRVPQRLILEPLLFNTFIKDLGDFGVYPQQIQIRGYDYRNKEQALINWRTGPAKTLRTSTRRSIELCVAGATALCSAAVWQPGDWETLVLKGNLNWVWTSSSLSSWARQIACWAGARSRNVVLLCRTCTLVLCLLTVRLHLEYFVWFWASLLRWDETEEGLTEG